MHALLQQSALRHTAMKSVHVCACKNKSDAACDKMHKGGQRGNLQRQSAQARPQATPGPEAFHLQEHQHDLKEVAPTRATHQAAPLMLLHASEFTL